MSNMSYCRFENTANDMRDCVNAINDALDNNVAFHEFINSLSSRYEASAFRNLYQLAAQFVARYDELHESENEEEGA